MDRTTRWETEALRSQPHVKKAPPQPSRKRSQTPREWVTLREAEAATGIPTNTLRKWVRKDELASHLESDGDMALRMVDLKDVRRRAKTLGRSIASENEDRETVNYESAAETPEAADSQAADSQAADSEQQDPTQGTMIVPIDAWNKMLNQLGNLHEAGQQLAEARERAAKAETESVFLRDRLAEIRGEPTMEAAPPPAPEEPAEPSPDASTSYWRYLTTGWRNRSR